MPISIGTSSSSTVRPSATPTATPAGADSKSSRVGGNVKRVTNTTPEHILSASPVFKRVVDAAVKAYNEHTAPLCSGKYTWVERHNSSEQVRTNIRKTIHSTLNVTCADPKEVTSIMEAVVKTLSVTEKNMHLRAEMAIRERAVEQAQVAMDAKKERLASLTEEPSTNAAARSAADSPMPSMKTRVLSAPVQQALRKADKEVDATFRIIESLNSKKQLNYTQAITNGWDVITNTIKDALNEVDAPHHRLDVAEALAKFCTQKYVDLWAKTGAAQHGGAFPDEVRASFHGDMLHKLKKEIAPLLQSAQPSAR